MTARTSWSAHPARSAVSWEHGHRPSRRLEAQEHQRWRARFHPLSYALGCSRRQDDDDGDDLKIIDRSEENTSELQSLMRISYAVFCLKKKITSNTQITTIIPKTNTIYSLRVNRKSRRMPNQT